MKVLEERQRQIHIKDNGPFQMECDRRSVAGSVSQRACVFCGSRVVLYPITDALHLVHGPIGCAAYTWDIRGALSSDRELYRMSFSSDLREADVIYGGEAKLEASLHELIEKHEPKAAFVYATCISGVIGDDVDAVCERVSREKGIPVIAVHSEGFRGTKKDGYRAACEAILKLMDTPAGTFERAGTPSVSILGDFNVAGETWVIRDYYEQMGISVIATITGDGRVDDIRRAPMAHLNVVQCSGSMMHLAKAMQDRYGIPFIRVSFFGIEDTARALWDVARFFGGRVRGKTRELIRREYRAIEPSLRRYRRDLEGKLAAVYVGGAFKAFSLIKALRRLGMEVVVVGSQTGNQQDYATLREICVDGTIIVDDSNPLELAAFLQEKGASLFIGGVKERPIAYKLGIGFCDHNHERKSVLAGFEGMLNFASEVHSSVMSPVWNYVRGEA